MHNRSSAADGREVGSSPPQPMAISVEEVAELLGLSARKIGELVSTRSLPSFKIGSRRLFRPDEIKVWLDLGAPATPGAEDAVRDRMAKAVTA